MSKPNIAVTLRRRAETVKPVETSTTAQSAEDQAYEVLFGGKLIPSQGRRTATLPIDQLHPFCTANIGFKPYSEENLRALADDIAVNGLIEAIKVRPIADGYEILGGHNRVAACKLLGWTEIPANIEPVDDDRAIVIATVTNLQRRQGLLPSERGWAYRALLEAHKRQGKRSDLFYHTCGQTCGQNDHMLKTRDTVAAFFGVDVNQLRRMIRITYLIRPLLDAVDERRLNLMCGVAISYYDEETQKLFWERLKTEDWQLTVAVMQRIKKACPSPHVSAAVLGKAWNLIDAERLQHSKPKTISFNRKKFAPYLSKVSSDQELEALFLEFLKAKYS